MSRQAPPGLQARLAAFVSSRVGGALLLVLGVAVVAGMLWAWPPSSGGRGAGMVLAIGSMLAYIGVRSLLGR